ncbi:MAG: AAA family ATPase [Spirochaetales bacterium]|nr:AAA family ATPase [Spirochaetales bacterium]
MDLFSSTAVPAHQPLAYRMRPRNLDEYAGQDHIIGPGRLLRRVIQADQLSSLIFYGPPGTGKTTLARVIANSTKSYFITINAVLSGVKQLREAIDAAKEKRDLHGRRTTLFIDEVHRWNKAQQDALLPWVENGTIILIGATTENPYFEVNPALVSRSRIFQLKSLNSDDLFKIARQCFDDTERGYGKYKLSIDQVALEHLVDTANGDARSLLNGLELAVETTPDSFPPPAGTEIHITLETAEESIQKKALLYDKEGDYHYDTISAFIKSIRGSDPDAALYWMARMIQAGEEPRFIFRRMLISACEDVGMADPAALGVVESAAAAYDRIGLPEGKFHLTQAVLYLATAPKSNSTMGYFDAARAVDQELAEEVPNHLKDGSRDKHGFGHGVGYLYPHAYRDHWVAQQYLPRGLAGKIFYQPSNQGYEKSIQSEVARKRELQLETVMEEPSEEVLTNSPVDRKQEGWLRRTSGETAGRLKSQRDEIFRDLTFNRNDRVLIPVSGSGFLVWEALRHVPEGGVYALVKDQERGNLIESLAEKLSPAERPVIINSLEGEPGLKFEKLIGRQLLSASMEKLKTLHEFTEKLSPGGIISLAEIVPKYSPRLSDLIQYLNPAEDVLSARQKKALRAAETALYDNEERPLTGWSEETLKKEIENSHYELLKWEVQFFTETAILPEEVLRSWLSPDKGGYGGELKEHLGKEELSELTDLICRKLTKIELPWKRGILFGCLKK